MTSTQPPIDIRFEIRLNPEHADWTRVAYDQIYAGDRIRHRDSLYRWIIGLLSPVAGRRLLDVACGEGALPHIAHDDYGLEAYGTDLSVTALRTGYAEGYCGFGVAVGEALPFATASFDYVTCVGSLEHFLDMHQGASEIARVLRRDGLACILVPNTYSLFNNMYKALKTGMSTVDMQPLQRYAARKEWIMLLESAGLEVVETIKYEREPPLSLADAWWYVQHPREMVKLTLAPLVPLNWANHFAFICRRASETSR